MIVNHCKVVHSCSYLPSIFVGIGKTHYIIQKLKAIPTDHHVTIAVNETFSIASAIERLTLLPHDEEECAVFFNFTILPSLEVWLNRSLYQQIQECEWLIGRVLL